jgi:hypothetical protein
MVMAEVMAVTKMPKLLNFSPNFKSYIYRQGLLALLSVTPYKANPSSMSSKEKRWVGKTEDISIEIIIII